MSPIADSIRFCSVCSKPIATESAYKRHISYCRRRKNCPAKRPRSCRECYSAKSKCSFELECTRCKSKGLRCVYEKRLVPNQAIETAKNRDESPSNITTGPDASLTSYTFGASVNLALSASSARPATALLADPVAQHSTRFILEAVRGLPLTMTSRETFSWFIHGYWYEPELPRSLTRCSEIVTLHTTRKPRVEDSFRVAINKENRRLLRDLPDNSLEELYGGMQSMVIFMICYALESDVKDGVPEVCLQMLMTFEVFFQRLAKVSRYPITTSEIFPNGFSAVDELSTPGVTWESWIHAETRRRCAITWFLLSRVMDLKFGVLCESVANYRNLPLPAPGLLWNARTRSEWEAHRKLFSQGSNKSLRTFGDLIEARSCPPSSERGQQLSRWQASCDKLGLLLTLATTTI
ncbi:hypothetical protein GGR54DRAFT_634177 [Hypoxylon sp. NC1633]|nr:hypothetical protein GGR54DRAFT_634177 [Hypoxylon sp. NC1633]